MITLKQFAIATDHTFRNKNYSTLAFYFLLIINMQNSLTSGSKASYNGK